MALLRAIALTGLTLFSLVPAAFGRDPFIEDFPRLYEDFMTIFESLGGRRYLEAVQNGEEINMQQDYTALNNFFGECLRKIITTDVVFLRPDILNGYEKIDACVNPVTFCGGAGQGLIRYTEVVNNAAGTDFRYGFDGPGNLQGTFWIENQDADADEDGAVLMNFAKSLDPTPLSPGAVLQPDPDGVNFKIRVAGDRTFAFSTDGGTEDSAFDQAIRQDLIYDYALTSGNNPFNPAGSIATPQGFDVFPTFKIPGMPCIRIRFRPCLMFIYQLQLSIDARAADTDPRVWSLTARQFGTTTVTNYKYKQIIDGNGDETDLFQDFVDSQELNDTPGVVYFRARRDNTPLVPCGVII